MIDCLAVVQCMHSLNSKQARAKRHYAVVAFRSSMHQPKSEASQYQATDSIGFMCIGDASKKRFLQRYVLSGGVGQRYIVQ